MAYSVQQFTSTGVEDHVILSFPYLDKTDIHLYGNSVETAFVWVSDTRLDFPPFPAGTEVVVRRITDRSRVRYLLQEGAPFTRAVLDQIHTQALYIAQESIEGAWFDIYGDIDMHGFRVRNAGNPELPTDYTTKEWVESRIRTDSPASHQNLTNRSDANAHPASAINWAEYGTSSQDLAAKTLALSTPNGASTVGYGSGTVASALDEAATSSELAASAVSEAAAVSAGIRNRSSVKFLSCPPTTNNGGELLTMQSFWLDPIKQEVWLGYDNSARSRQVIERRKYNGTVISSDVYTGASSIGHLDGFHVNADGSVWCTDTYANPSVIRVQGGAVLERLTYSVPTNGNQILAVDRSFQDQMVILTKDSSNVLKVYVARFSEAISGVLQLTDVGIEVPATETVQGLAVLYDRVYMLTGAGGLFDNKYLYEWRLADGVLIARMPHNPNRLYADTDYGANSREPEGLNVLFEGLHNEQAVQIYTGVLFANFANSVVHNVIFKHSPAVARSAVPAFNGWVGRADGAEQSRPVIHSILFRKVAGAWKVWDGAFESALSKALVTRVVAGGASNRGLVFDLANSYQCVLGVSVTCNAGLRQAAGVELYWVENGGGSNSRFNQKLNFLRVADNAYLDADDPSIPDGSWISLQLTVVM